VTIYEPHRLGGKLKTSDFAGLPVDEGPDAFLTRTPAAVGLAESLGLTSQLVAPRAGTTMVYFAGRLHRLPAGLVLGVPTDLRALATSRLLGPLGAARAAWDLVAPRTSIGEDASVDDLVAGRFGARVAKRLVEPLLGSIHAASTADLSAAATAPNLLEAARSSRSLLIGLKRQAPPSSGPRTPIFLSPSGGMSVLVDTLTAHLRAAGVHFVANAAASLRVGRDAASRVVVNDTGYDAAVVALAAKEASRVLGDQAPSSLDSLESTDVVVATLCVDRGSLGVADDVNGILVPPTHGMLMTACSFGSNKWPHWASQPDRMVLRISAGRHGDFRASELSDADLVETLLGELGTVMRRNLSAKDWRVSRWPGAFPLYRVGHLGWVRQVHAEMARNTPRVALAGSSYNGAGIPACIASGQSAARQVSAAVSATSANL
jgi:oxygen-dependent protoporphyrinogen oxidase